VSDAKRALRTRIAALRRSLSEAQRLVQAEEMAVRLIETSAWTTALRVALYADLPDEVPTRALQLAAEASGRPILWPRINDGQLEFAICPVGSLAPAHFGIPTPPDSFPASPLAAGDLLITPAVAFDRSGQRLGRGGGFYDRALAALAGRAPSVAIGYDFQLVDEIPTEPHDVPVDTVVTNAGIWNPGFRSPTIGRRETS
jgi:5-formyltetrahydrofolate cyclo-ligase